MNRLIAHRGDMTTYPENSVLAFQKAAMLGFQHLELDIQFSKDIEPIVIHDESLRRTTGIDNKVWDLKVEELQSISLLRSKNLDDEKELLFIPSLEQIVQLLNQYSKLNVFVEIKKESVEKFGLETVVNRVLDVQKNANFNIIIISFLSSVVRYVKSKQLLSTGYVLKKYDDKNFKEAKDMQPEYLFCNVKKINQPDQLWNGSWKWALYDISNPDFAYELLEQGVDLIETGDIVKLSNSEYFK